MGPDGISNQILKHNCSICQGNKQLLMTPTKWADEKCLSAAVKATILMRAENNKRH